MDWSLLGCWPFTSRNRSDSTASRGDLHTHLPQLLENSHISLAESPLTKSYPSESDPPVSPVPSVLKDTIETYGKYLAVQLDCLIIPSFGDSPPSDVKKKKGTGTFLYGVKDDLKAIQKLLLDDKNKQLVGIEFMCHFMKVDISSFLTNVEDLMQRIKFESSDGSQKGLLLWYSGHGKMISGDWAFDDGCVAFEKIYDLYMRYFKGRYLYIVTDCCYSGAWVVECARLLDRDGITCSHAAKREQVYIKVFASCLHNQSAHDKFYTTCKGVRSSRSDTKTILFPKHRKICDGEFFQTTLGVDFTQDDRCVVDHDGVCHPYTWTRCVQSLIYEDESKEYCI